MGLPARLQSLRRDGVTGRAPRPIATVRFRSPGSPATVERAAVPGRGLYRHVEIGRP